jgi:hypothetical protein
MTQLNPDPKTMLSVIKNIPGKKREKIQSFANNKPLLIFPEV